MCVCVCVYILIITQCSTVHINVTCLFQTPVQRLTLRLTRFYTATPCQRVWSRLQQVMKKFSYDVRTSPDKVSLTGTAAEWLSHLRSMCTYVYPHYIQCTIHVCICIHICVQHGTRTHRTTWGVHCKLLHSKCQLSWWVVKRFQRFQVFVVTHYLALDGPCVCLSHTQCTHVTNIPYMYMFVHVLTVCTVYTMYMYKCIVFSLKGESGCVYQRQSFSATSV